MIDKKLVNNYVSRMHRFLNKHGDKLIFKKCKGNAGYYVSDDEKPKEWHIELDYRQHLLTVLWHEVLHRWYPDWNHTEIYKMTSAIINGLSIKQVKNILKKIGQVI